MMYLNIVNAVFLPLQACLEPKHMMYLNALN